MKEQKLYVCDFCHTQYSDKHECVTCEKSHKTKISIKECRYVSYKNDRSGFPNVIVIADSMGNTRIYR